MTRAGGGRASRRRYPVGRACELALSYAYSALDAVADAEAPLLLTEWQEFRDADPEELGKAVARRNIVDGRNALDADRWREAGWTYRALGRPS